MSMGTERLSIRAAVCLQTLKSNTAWRQMSNTSADVMAAFLPPLALIAARGPATAAKRSPLRLREGNGGEGIVHGGRFSRVLWTARIRGRRRQVNSGRRVPQID